MAGGTEDAAVAIAASANEQIRFLIMGDLLRI
jgi:hypothetical protein